jgi:hypothetical protein
MTAKAGLHPVVGIALIALASTSVVASSARAQDTCLTAPDAPAPAGTHWYYRTDQATQRKCWYTRPQDQAAQPQSEQQTTQSASTATQAASDKLARRVQAALAAKGGKATQQDAQPAPRAGGEPTINAAAWVDPTPAVSKVTWPAPPPPPPADDANATTAGPASAAAATPNVAAENPPAVQPSNATSDPSGGTAAGVGSAGGQTAIKAGAEPSKPTVFPSDMPNAMGLAGVIALLIAGFFLRRSVAKAFRPRRKVVTERREPVLTANVAADPPTPQRLARSPNLVPGNAASDHTIDEVEDALRKLAQRFRRPRSTPFKIVPPIRSGESAEAEIRSRPSGPNPPPKVSA